MAADGQVEVDSAVSVQIDVVKSGVECVNCAVLEKQLLNALLELKSAETIIAVLNEDLKCDTNGSSDEYQLHAPTSDPSASKCEISDHIQSSEKWVSVVRNISKRKVACDSNEVN